MTNTPGDDGPVPSVESATSTAGWGVGDADGWVFEALAHPRRRRLLRALAAETPRSVLDLAGAVAERERSSGDATGEHRTRVHHSLVHAHLPKLADMGIVRVDEGEVALARNADRALAMLATAERVVSTPE